MVVVEAVAHRGGCDMSKGKVKVRFIVESKQQLTNPPSPNNGGEVKESAHALSAAPFIQTNPTLAAQTGIAPPELRPSSLPRPQPPAQAPAASPAAAAAVTHKPNMAAPASAYKDRQFLAVIGDEVRTSPTIAMGPG